MSAPLAIDLFCGLGGWTDGLLAEGYYVVGFDIEDHRYGEHRYPGRLVIQDVLTLHGFQFKDAALIVASPPCQEFSYMAMPWTKAKAKAAAIRADKTGESLERLNRLFNACFRIQREACEAAGHHIPLVVENVRGANPWVGRSRWSYGSFHLWGDVPALMPFDRAVKVSGFRFDGGGRSFQTASVDSIKNTGGSWFAIGSPGQKVVGQNPDGRLKNRRNSGVSTPHLTNPDEHADEGVRQGGSGAAWFDDALNSRRWAATAIKNGGDWFSSGEGCSLQRKASSGSTSRKAASALIAKIPLPLSRHIAATYRPKVSA